MIKLIIICGATAVGKTDFSIKIAKRIDAEIINADASQFKRYLNIGTAKISEEEMDGIKHHLIDIIDPCDDFSISDYQSLARLKIDEIHKRNKNIIICGGSGLYIDALVNDYHLNADKSNHQLDDELYNQYSNEELYKLLESLDKDLATLTHPNNRNRVLRYIERAKCGDSIKNDNKALYDCMYLFLNRDRDDLYNRINQRTILMLENGWIDECLDLRNKGFDLSKIKEIGYKEIGDYLDNIISYDELVDLIQKETRHYAKRQITWFKNKTKHQLIDINNYNIEDIIKKINLFLKGEENEK